MKNEFGEEISTDEIKRMAGKIRDLSPEEIDELCFRLPFIISDHEPNLKALRDEDIRKAKGTVESAMDFVKMILAETPLSELMSNLQKTISCNR